MLKEFEGFASPVPSAPTATRIVAINDSMQREELSDQELLELFNLVDLDHSGSIDHEELITLLEKVGFGDDPEEVKAIVDSVDKDGNGDIDPYEFIAGFQKKLDFDAKKLKQAFAFFAKGTPKGVIKTAHLIDALSQFSDLKDSPEQVEKLIRVMIPENVKKLPNEIDYGSFVDAMVDGS
ncbi:uncharacterized protein MONOS_10817 [Monocercomonoides exilis]|uniref:uncharacterized protein n=1 Tax=Monocercomonoides exilis TaxID=2049356 RepID=UPI0035594264|nr:hypothetical protein MONOS_10817 [Monocercomonoides exilis]|eukprot:MONOS_10817.1-p1 / transcript=MONOS_10817.1 / gene=MONOS_10817 / organism=Monocercomonoides_exilis_PA203 / gene_product=unspecified product / transcript_product=unspecified product / location=Mono_scaffold00507:19409-20456(-) / protein_length=179 / sequence_SO=supercontig / SO=protein_coding / is_pseudo=false